jgi:hypothetical protein
MNDHPAHAGDIVRRRRDRLIVTVTHVEPNTHLLHTTQWTGGVDIPMRDNEVDVLTPAGVA